MGCSLGLSMIVKNEEKNISRLLNFSPNLFDQIVIVDTGSTDNTVNLLQDMKSKLNLTIIQDNWQDDFSWSRNRAFSHLTTDLICWLDADDVVPENTQTFLQDLKNQDLKDLPAGFEFDYQYYENDRPYLTVKRTNLLRRDHFVGWQYPVYEQLKLLTNQIFNAPFVIQHKTDPDLQDQKRNKYLNILMKMLNNPDDRLHAHQFLAFHYLGLKNMNEAINHLKQIVELEPEHIMGRIQLLQMLAKQGQMEEFKNYFTHFISLPEIPAIVLPLWGLYHELQNESEQAIEVYKRAQAIDFESSYWLSKELSLYWSKFWSTQRLVRLYRENGQTDKMKTQQLALLQYMSAKLGQWPY